MRRLALLPLLFIPLLPLAGGLYREKEPAATPPSTLHVAAVQMRSGRDLEANIEHTIALLRRCKGEGAEVAVAETTSKAVILVRVVVEAMVDELKPTPTLLKTRMNHQEEEEAEDVENAVEGLGEINLR